MLKSSWVSWLLLANIVWKTLTQFQTWWMIEKQTSNLIIKTYITPVPQKLPTDLNLSSTNQPVQTNIQVMGLEQESNLLEGKGYFIRQPSTGLQQQHLNTKRKFTPVQCSLLEHSIRLILRYNELISQCHLQPFLYYYTQTEPHYLQGYSKENNHIDPISLSLCNPSHLTNSSSLCICILQVFYFQPS